MLRSKQHCWSYNYSNYVSATPFLGAHVLTSYRYITSRGQFNPIHDFSYGIAHSRRADNASEFSNLITNPGPIRVGFSPDYLDWLYKGYKSKVKFTDTKARAECIFNGNLMSSSSLSSSKISGTNKFNDKTSTMPLSTSVPSGMFLRPLHSFRRRGGELQRASAQRVLDETAQQQGLLDLIERQSQFPVIHIDKATRFHVVELFKELILDKALSPVEIWDKALLYRAILFERKASYPASFKYILNDVDNTLLANEKANYNKRSSTYNSPSSMSSVPLEGNNDKKDNDNIDDNDKYSEDAEQSILRTRCPTSNDYYYFLFLVRRYYVDNVVEGHVILRCHREPNAHQLLFSNPPPRDEHDVMRSVLIEINANKAKNEQSSNSSLSSPSSQQVNGSSFQGERLVAPTHYPPIEALWRCEENVPLLRILVFGELNLMVSENPFTKFPNAHSFLTRPYSAEGIMSVRSSMPYNNRSSSDNSVVRDEDGSTGGVSGLRSKGGSNAYRREDEVSSLANIIAEKRGHLLPPIARNLAPVIDTRGQDIQRLLQRHHREDIIGFQRLMRSYSAADAGGVVYSSFSDYAYFNPRTVRAEVRDLLQRKALKALKMYERADNALYRQGYETIQSNNLFRPSEAQSSAPSYIPTLPRFVSVITSNPHISLLLHTLPITLVTTTTTTATIHNRNLDNKYTQGELEQCVFQLARALHQVALNYHKEEVRRVNRQKVNIAAVILDRFVSNSLQYIVINKQVSCGADSKNNFIAYNNTITNSDDLSTMVERLGQYLPFEHRVLDENGFMSDARIEDYKRWMAAPRRQV